MAEDEPALPGLDRLRGDITLREVRGDNGLAEALAETDILVVTDFRVEALEAAWPDPCPIRWVHATSAGVGSSRQEEEVPSRVIVASVGRAADLACRLLGAWIELVCIVEDEHTTRLALRTHVLAPHADVEVVVATRDRRPVGQLKLDHLAKVHVVCTLVRRPCIAARVHVHDLAKVAPLALATHLDRHGRRCGRAARRCRRSSTLAIRSGERGTQLCDLLVAFP